MALFLEHANSIKNSFDSISALSDDKSKSTNNVVDLSISAQYISTAFYSIIDFCKINLSSNMNVKINQSNISQIINDVSSGFVDLELICIDKSQKSSINHILSLNKLEFSIIFYIFLYMLTFSNFFI